MCLLWHDISRLVLVANYKQCCLFTCEASYYHLAPSPGDTRDTDPPWDDLSTRGPGRELLKWNERGSSQQPAASAVARCEYDPALQWLQSRPRDWSAAAAVTYHRTIDINQSRHHIPSQMHRCTQHLTPACIWHLHLGFHPPAAEALRQPGTRQPGTGNQHSDLVAALTINLGL